MTTKSLTTFERRFGDWMTIHPPPNFLGKDEEIFLSNQFSRVVAAQLITTDRIIASQEDIADGIDKVALGIDKISEGIDSLYEVFEWGFTEVIWRIEQTNELLQEILQVLQAPLDTQAKELKKRGEEAYRNGWFGDALNDFLKSEKKNRYDFTIHHYLGNIYLFHKQNPIKALEYYKKAVKYAIPKSPKHAAFSLIHVGLINYLHKDFQQAYESTLRSLELSSNLYEAHYQHAQYCAVLGKCDKAIQHLRIAIVEGSSYFCIKASLEKDFDVMKEEVTALFNELRDEAHSQTRSEVDKTNKLIEEAKSYGVSNQSIKIAKEKINEVATFLKRKSYFGCLKALRETNNVKKYVADSLIKCLNEIIDASEKGLRKLERKTEHKVSETWDLAWIVVVILAVIPTYFFGLFITPLLPPSYAWFGIFLSYFFFLFTFPAFWNWMTLRHYLPMIKNEEDKLNTLKKNLSKFRHLSENISLDYGRKKIFTKELRFNYGKEANEEISAGLDALFR